MQILRFMRSRGRLRGASALPALVIALASLLAGSAASASTVPSAPPTYAWLFDDGSGSTLTASAGGHDGTLVNGPSWSSNTPYSYAGNGSLYFDGSNQYVDVPSLDHALEGWTDFTLSIWIRSDLDYEDRAMWSGQEPGNSDLFTIRYDSAGWLSGGSTANLIKFGMYLDGVGYQYESAEFTQKAGAWQNLVWMWENGVGLKLFIDGVIDVPTATTFSGVSGALSDQPRFIIGDGAKDNWRGNIDELLIWNDALVQEEVDWIVEGTGAPLVPEPGSGLLLALGLIQLALRPAAAAHLR
jgi:hypothetical protein